MVTYIQCPVCKNTKLQNTLVAKDFTVSNENFTIVKCITCTHMFTQNVASQNEIGKYYASENYISHSDTQKGFVNKLYHTIRKKTLVAKQNLLQKETGLQTGNVLDIGCGTGAFLNTMQTAGWNIQGLEPDYTARLKAKELYNIEAESSEKIFEKEAYAYDAITMWHVLEHVHELQEYIAQQKKMIRTKGKIFIAVPNYTSYDAKYYKEYWAAYDVPRHLYHFSPKSMATLLAPHGLKIDSIKPMWYDSFYVSMLSEKYKNGKGNMVKALFIGLISNLNAFFNKEKCSSVIYIISTK
jgi:2-polyprenyl-3-methyl-5-hydroxy-6-metoxy-1,4-benzoquinol methylase